jgi:hypothetical protein
MARGKKKQKTRQRNRRHKPRRRTGAKRGNGAYVPTPLPWDNDSVVIEAIEQYEDGAVKRMDAILRAGQAGVLPGALVAYDLFEAFLVHVLDYEKLTPDEVATFLRRTLLAAQVAGEEHHFDVRIRAGAPPEEDCALVRNDAENEEVASTPSQQEEL